jgi:hypothetical protein
VKLIHPLVEPAARAFIDNIAKVYHGRLDRALLDYYKPLLTLSMEDFERLAQGRRKGLLVSAGGEADRRWYISG